MVQCQRYSLLVCILANKIQEFILRGGSLGPNDPALSSNQYVSVSTTNPLHRSITTLLDIAKLPPLVRPDNTNNVCFFTTARGSACVTHGNEPDLSAARLWEAGGRVEPIISSHGTNDQPWWSWLKAAFGNRCRHRLYARAFAKGSSSAVDDEIETSSTPSTPHKVQQEELVVRSARTWVKNARLHVETTTTTATTSNDNPSSSESVGVTTTTSTTTESEVTWRSPRPSTFWKAWFPCIFEEGREIRDAKLTVSPQGEVNMEALSGRRLLREVIDGSDVGFR